MAILQIPVRSDLASYKFTLPLDGGLYGFRFRFNDRMGLWIMDLATSDDVNIVCGIPVQTNVDLKSRFPYAGLPPGGILAYDETGGRADATRDNFGGDVKLYYKEVNAT